MKPDKLAVEPPLQIDLLSDSEAAASGIFDLDRILFDQDTGIKALSNHADSLDGLVSIASGLLCGALDLLWVGEFSLAAGREYASDRVEGLVQKTAKMFGCREDGTRACVAFLEKKFPIPSDGNTPEFGGGLQHHLRDFAHHPTLVGLAFSLLTQFTGRSYGADASGNFLVVEVPEKSRIFIGDDVPAKIVNGTVIWFFHLVSDIAGSSSTAGLNGGTGIPGPILSLAKELSVLPPFKNMRTADHTLPVFLSRLFNGTLLAKRNEAGAIRKESVLKFDLRGELGAGIELGRQALPVIANECMVRTFCFIRRLAFAPRENSVSSLEELNRLDWNRIKPSDDPTLARMLTLAAGVFTAIDIGEAVVTQKYWVAVNYPGVGRFAVALGQDVAWCLKARKVKQIRRMYEETERFAYRRKDDKDLQNPLAAYQRGEGDAYLDALFSDCCGTKGYIKRLRKCYGKVQRELNEVLKAALTSAAGRRLGSASAPGSAGASAQPAWPERKTPSCNPQSLWSLCGRSF